MRTLLLTGAAALSLAAMPFVATAQDAGAAASADTSASVSLPGAPAVRTANEANAALPPTTDTTITTRTTGAGQQEVITTVTGNAAPPPMSAMNKDYPICHGAVQDSCQNPGEGGAPGQSRALDYWPGAPASELDASAKAAASM